jgi:hypothetical protein
MPRVLGQGSLLSCTGQGVAFENRADLVDFYPVNLEEGAATAAVIFEFAKIPAHKVRVIGNTGIGRGPAIKSNPHIKL